MIRKAFFVFVMTALAVMWLNNASAATIFSDGFESGTLTGWNTTSTSSANNWTVLVNGSSPGDAYQGSYSARAQPQSTSEPASILHKNISTVGFQNITFGYYRRLVGIDAADEFKARWLDGTVD